MEATLAIGLMSFGFLALVPLLALGLQTARIAHDDRSTAQIAQTFIEEAKEGNLLPGTTYLDIQGNTSTSAGAAYSAQASLLPVSSNALLTQLTLRITPLDAPGRARTYAVVLPASS